MGSSFADQLGQLLLGAHSSMYIYIYLYSYVWNDSWQLDYKRSNNKCLANTNAVNCCLFFCVIWSWRTRGPDHSMTLEHQAANWFACVGGMQVLRKDWPVLYHSYLYTYVHVYNIYIIYINKYIYIYIVVYVSKGTILLVSITLVCQIGIVDLVQGKSCMTEVAVLWHRIFSISHLAAQIMHAATRVMHHQSCRNICNTSLTDQDTYYHGFVFKKVQPNERLQSNNRYNSLSSFRFIMYAAAQSLRLRQWLSMSSNASKRQSLRKCSAINIW